MLRRNYTPLPRALSRALSLPASIGAGALAIACSASPGPDAPTSGGTLECPPPIGPITRESCADVAREYDVISVEGALKHAGTGASAERRSRAIEAAGSLAAALKAQRTSLCEQSNACKVTPKDRDARDKALADLMNELVKLWDKRALDDPASVERFYAEVIALKRSLDPSAGGDPGGAAARATSGASSDGSSALTIDASKLTRAASASTTITVEGDAVRVTAVGDGPHDALRAGADLTKLTAGKRYLIKLSGTYAPASPPLISPGDEIKIRLKFRAAEASTLYAALRSIEDPESDEATTEWKLAAGEKGARDATLTAPQGSTGVYVGLGVRGAGAVELDDVEATRGGKLLASATAESDAEASVKTSCALVTKSAISGKRSIRCVSGAGDALTLGNPAAYFYMAVRSQGADRAALRSTSLDGGRSLDATLSADAELVVGLFGPGTATVRSLEISALSK